MTGAFVLLALTVLAIAGLYGAARLVRVAATATDVRPFLSGHDPVEHAVSRYHVLYGALVALAQRNFKRMVAYTSVNHMGYVVLAVGAAGLVSTSDTQAQTLASTGAVTQMVSHGPSSWCSCC